MRPLHACLRVRTRLLTRSSGRWLAGRTPQLQTPPMIASPFRLLATRSIPALGLEVTNYQHACGAQHWHLGCNDEHRAFVVAFRTPPSDSTGLPHILEHTTLCGSRRFPVRDPFFQMLRRSLQTVMNAMTFPDLTAYPCATQVPKDFDNLLSVYLDAVFSPNLHRLAFAQEGHRLEQEGGTWLRKGVVYNEMKGAMDSTAAQLDAARERMLLAGTIYRHNSGGEPADIPRLRHQDLVDFHRRCYRPANALFVTYGNCEPARLHAALAAYIGPDAGEALPAPMASSSALTPQEIDVPVPLAANQDPADATAACISWLQGDASTLDEVLECELLDRLLLGHAGAPLRRVLEASQLGRSIGHSGYGSSYRNGLFSAEIEGIKEADYPRLEPLVQSCLAQVAREGFLPMRSKRPCTSSSWRGARSAATTTPSGSSSASACSVPGTMAWTRCPSSTRERRSSACGRPPSVLDTWPVRCASACSRIPAGC